MITTHDPVAESPDFGSLSIESVDGREALQDETFVRQWRELLTARGHVNAMYASPEWLAHLAACDDRPLRLWTVCEDGGALIGLLVAQLGRYSLQFAVSSRVLARRSFRAAAVLGSIPLLPVDEALHRQVFASVFQQWPHCDCLYFDALPTDSPLWQMCAGRRQWSGGGHVHVVDGPRPWFLLDLADSFDDYLKRFNSKSRSTLRRKQRQADKSAWGPMTITRCSQASEVASFLQNAVAVSQHTWQHRILGERIRSDTAAVANFQQLADQGILRCYLLTLGETPCAFVVGYQYDGVYHYAELGFREDLANLSPGTILLYAIIEDLHAQNPPQVLNFGVGAAAYKRRFGTRELSDAGMLILRKGLQHRVVTTAHRTFNFGIDVTKRILGRRVAD